MSSLIDHEVFSIKNYRKRFVNNRKAKGMSEEN